MMRGWWSRQRGLILASLFSLGLVTAVWGFMEQGKNFPNAIHLTLQLILLNVDLSGGIINWQLQLARFLLPGIAAYATITSFLILVGHHAHFLRLKLRPPHAIFLGAGRLSVGLVEQLRGTATIVALDVGINHAHAGALVASGVDLFAGDATDIENLRKLNIAKAKFVYVLTGDDRRNLDIAKDIVTLIDKNGPKPRLIIAIADSTLLRLACGEPDFVEYRKREGTVTWINAPAQAARVLLRDYPPDRETTPIAAGTPIHVAIAGFGPHGQAIALQAARNCIYSDGRRIHISVFAEDRRAYDDFLLRYPVMDPAGHDPAYGGFVPVVELSFITYQTGAAAPASIRNAQLNGPFSLVYVAMEDDYSSLSTSLRFAQTIRSTGGGCKVICILPGTRFGKEADAREVTDRSPDAYDGIELFHAINRCIKHGETYPGADSDLLGIAIDTVYRSECNADPGSLTQGLLGRQRKYWEEQLNDDFRWSSRHSADHIPVKLRAIGFDIAGSDTPDARIDSETLRSAIAANRELLERMEHRRYCIERLIDGWLYMNSESDDAEKRDKALQLNKTLIPFDELSSADQHKDAKIVQSIPNIIAATGSVLICKRSN